VGIRGRSGFPLGTDLLFGSNRGKGFLTIVGARTKERLGEHELKGLLFRAVAP
jgi:hypothetical protein